MKKIVFLTHGLSANGIETFLVNILRKINKSRFDVSVIIAIDKGVFSIHEQELVDMGIHILHAGDLDGIAKKLQYIKNLRRYLREGKYDAVHTNMDLLNGIVLFEANGAGITMRICMPTIPAASTSLPVWLHLLSVPSKSYMRTACGGFFCATPPSVWHAPMLLPVIFTVKKTISLYITALTFPAFLFYLNPTGRCFFLKKTHGKYAA